MMAPQGFSQSLRQVIDFVHCGVEYHASFTKQSLSSTLEKFLAVTTAQGRFWGVLIVMAPQGFSQCLRQVIAFVHCGVEYHASFTKQSLSSTLEKFLAVTTAQGAYGT